MKNFSGLMSAAETIKSESERLRSEFEKTHADYMLINAELQKLDHSPPHRSELEQLLAAALDRIASLQRVALDNIVAPWTAASNSGRAEARHNLVDHLVNSPGLIPALTALLLREELPTIVGSLAWPEATKPAERESLRVELEKRLSVTRARLDELISLAAGVGIALRV